MTVPSRRANPFATCWLNAQTVPLVVVDDATFGTLLSALGEPLAAAAIVGPHGAGKTTLALQAAERLRTEGWRIYWSELHDGNRNEGDLVPTILERHSKVLQVVDGYEQLNCWQRWRVRRRCRQQGASLLVTSHHPTSVPTLLRLDPQIEAALAIFHHLTAEIPTPVSPEDVIRGFAECGGNLRDLWFHLYDLHELRKVESMEGMSAEPQSEGL